MNKLNSATSVQDSGAFVETFNIDPTGNGSLDNLTFAVKDLIDVAGYKTGCGNPTWSDTHPVARTNAVCVDQLLSAGARLAGKTVSDELAFSLSGENYFWGTPLNPKAPARVPGGSSSGSASAVACGLVDFALGTDTGGSVRVPASNCGIWGYRPSHDFISLAGIMPFAPSFDTVGVLAPTADILVRVARVLTGNCAGGSAGDSAGSASKKSGSADYQPASIYVLTDAFELCDPETREAHQPALENLRRVFGERVCNLPLDQIANDLNGTIFDACVDNYCTLQWSEIECSLRSWIDENNPSFGPATAKNFELTRNLDRSLILAAITWREQFFRKLQQFLSNGKLLCAPTTCAPAAIKGSLGSQQRTGSYYRKLLSLTSVSGLGRLPQVTMPLSTVAIGDEILPVGLSLLAGFGHDSFLLDLVQTIQ